MCLACALMTRRSRISTRRDLLRGAVAFGVVEAVAPPVFAAATVSTADAAPVLIVAGDAWDGLAAKPLGPMSILSEKGRIAAMAQTLPPQPGVRVVSLPG